MRSIAGMEVGSPFVVPGDDAGSRDVTRAVAAHFRHHGWVHIRPDPARPLTEDLARWADEVSAWGDGDGTWLQHRELTDTGPALCRTENLAANHAGIDGLLCEGSMVEIAGLLLGEPAVLYKDKLNHKLPGGAGYAPHQDAPAYRFVENHVSCMIAIDDATVDNGCLEVVSGAHDRLWPTDESGCIHPDVVASMTWVPAPVRAGDTLWFHSRTPHRSGPNPSTRPRRALYPTYNARREGDLRERYYRQKAAELGDVRSDDRVPVSLIGDFQGRPVR